MGQDNYKGIARASKVSYIIDRLLTDDKFDEVDVVL